VSGDQILYATFVRAAREQVFDAFATAEGLDGWFTSGSSVSDHEIRFRWREWGPEKFTGSDGGRVLERRRPERFAFEWHTDSFSRPTTVEITFEEEDGGTVVRLRESGYPDDATGRRVMLDCASGWGEALTLMKFWVEHGIRY
jgi:uncharacterized protein YndB with AHSA1/START domain